MKKATAQMALEALKNLTEACLLADQQENLAQEIGGELLDAAMNSIEALNAELAQPVEQEIKPTYFVSHPDGSFSEANPQPGEMKSDCHVYAQCDQRHTGSRCEDPYCYIASAPQEPAVNAELLAALIHIQQVACSGSPELLIASEAIAKATGGAV